MFPPLPHPPAAIFLELSAAFDTIITFPLLKGFIFLFLEQRTISHSASRNRHIATGFSSSDLILWFYWYP